MKSKTWLPNNENIMQITLAKENNHKAKFAKTREVLQRMISNKRKLFYQNKFENDTKQK